MPTPQELADALRAIPPRAAQVLGYRLLEGHDANACAEHYGVTAEAFDVLLLRSAHPLAARFGFAQPLPDDFAAEQAMATGLRAALESNADDPLAAPLRALAAEKDAVRALLLQAEEAYLRSPAAQRELWLRRLAIVVVLALSAWFWWREQESKKPHLEPRPGQPAQQR